MKVRNFNKERTMCDYRNDRRRKYTQKAACAFVILTFMTLIITAGCQPQRRTAAQPVVATIQQASLIKDGTELFSPISGARITKGYQTPSVVYKNRLYFFCCQGHMRAFCAYPDQYADAVKPPNGMDITGAKLKDIKQPDVDIKHDKVVTKREPDTTIYDIAVGSSPVKGPNDAPVTIVEFVDVQCPYCVREWPKIKQILEEYPDKVRLVFKHFPLSFHKKAKPAHTALQFALNQGGSEAFWKMHDMVMSNPKKLETSDLRAYAESMKLDLADFDKLMTDGSRMDKMLRTDMLDVRKYKVRGTPTVFINGLKMARRNIEDYKTRIEQILTGADTEK